MCHNKELTEPFAVAEYFVDGFTNYEVRNGLMMCTAYRERGGLMESVIKLVFPLEGAMEAVAQREAVLRGVANAPDATRFKKKILS